MAATLEETYQEIADLIAGAIGEDWNWAKVEVLMDEEDHGRFICKYESARGRTADFWESGLFDAFEDLHGFFEDSTEGPWITATFLLKSDGEFNIDFGYESPDEEG